MGKSRSIVGYHRKILPTEVFFLALLFVAIPVLEPVFVSADELTIEVGDVLDVEVRDEPDLTVTREVGEDGSFQYHLLQTVKAAGKTPTELARHIEKRLYDEEFLVNPRATVKIKERRGYVVWVRGEVKNPGQSDLEQNMRLQDVLAKHEGILDDRAGPDIVLQGRKRPFPIRIDRHILLSSGPAGKLLDLVLRPGDEIIVPKAEEYTLAGAVQNPGSYAVTRRITLSELLPADRESSTDMTGWIVVRSKHADAPVETLVDIADLRDGNKVVDRIIHGGDYVAVLDKGYFYVGGLVERAGVHEWDKDLTLQQVLIGAGSLQHLKDRIIEVVRWGQEERIRFSPDDILSGRVKDMSVKERDVIFVLAE
ncbi:MAG: polysaccharide biosynthesis/export family protein [bacterium]